MNSPDEIAFVETIANVYCAAITAGKPRNVAWKETELVRSALIVQRATASLAKMQEKQK